MLTHVDRFLHFLEDEQDRSANTTAAYRNDLTQFTRFVQEQTASEQVSDTEIDAWRKVDDAVMQTYLGHLKQSEYASATVARKVAAIKSFFHWMQENGGLCENPADVLEAPKVRRGAPNPISPTEIERLLAAPGRDSTPQALRDRALMETLYASGMRVTEVVALDLGDLDLNGALLHGGGESKKSRALPLSSSTLRALEEYLAHGRVHLLVIPDEQALFLNHRGRRLTRQGLWLIIKRYVRQVGIKTTVTPHMLRQSFAVHQLNAGADLRQVQQTLGYVNAQTTQAYRRAADLSDMQGVRIIVDGKPYPHD